MFNLNKLHVMMMSPGGGTITYVMSTLDEKLTLCFNTIEFTILEFKDLDKKASKCDASAEKEQACDHLQSILNTLKRALPLHQVIIPKVWDTINAVFTGHLFADLETSGHLCQAHSFVYQSAFDQYCHTLIVMLEEEITQMNEDISLYEDDGLHATSQPLH
ncbi:hypothetical protein BKA82DRAFT_4348720 [Pisolithus tinctorius]|nr:hypothetical protein BKA82DRAFT_4348720 [Pisolithus tinctorius]